MGGSLDSALGAVVGGTIGFLVGGPTGAIAGASIGYGATGGLSAPSGGTQVVTPEPPPDVMTKNSVGNALDPGADAYNPEDEDSKRKAINKKKLGAKALQIPLETNTSTTTTTTAATTGVQL